MKSIVTRLRNALAVTQTHSRSVAREIVPYRSQNYLPMIPDAPPMPVSRFEEELAETGRFTMHAVVTEWNAQPGTPTARLGLQDFEMNAAMAQAGQTNINLTLAVAIAQYFAPQSRVRVTVERI